MTLTSATLFKLAESTFSPPPYYRIAEAPAGKEVKDLNAFVKEKIHETIKECNHNMNAINDFEDLSISSSNESIQSIISDTSDEELDNNSCKLAHKK
eukprot:10614023-Ditylum_brightwellii.AAC.1